MKTLSTLAICSSLIIAAGCGSTRTGSDVKSTNSAKTLTAQEWNGFGKMIVDEINQTGVITRYYGKNGGKPVVLGIGDFDNSTGRMSQNFARTKDVMYASIRSALVNGTGGMVSINMDVKGSGGRTDSLVQDSGQLRGSQEYDQSTTTQFGQAQAYALVLTGQIVTIEYEDGRTTRFDYAVNVILTDAKTRGSVFEKQIIFPKEMSRGLFGRRP